MKTTKKNLSLFLTFCSIVNYIAFLFISIKDDLDNFAMFMLYLSFLLAVLIFPCYYFLIYRKIKGRTDPKSFFFILLMINLLVSLFAIGTAIILLTNKGGL